MSNGQIGVVIDPFQRRVFEMVRDFNDPVQLRAAITPPGREPRPIVSGPQIDFFGDMLHSYCDDYGLMRRGQQWFKIAEDERPFAGIFLFLGLGRRGEEASVRQPDRLVYELSRVVTFIPPMLGKRPDLHGTIIQALDRDFNIIPGSVERIPFNGYESMD